MRRVLAEGAIALPVTLSGGGARLATCSGNNYCNSSQFLSSGDSCSRSLPSVALYLSFFNSFLESPMVVADERFNRQRPTSHTATHDYISAGHATRGGVREYSTPPQTVRWEYHGTERTCRRPYAAGLGGMGGSNSARYMSISAGVLSVSSRANG